MTTLSNRWPLLAAVALTSLAACNVEVTRCNESDADICDDDFDDFDAGEVSDRDSATDSAVSTDAGTDAASPDASATDSGSDAAADGDATAPTTLDLEGYCTAQLASGYAWRDALEERCGTTAQADQNDFLATYLLFPPSTAMADQIDQCIAARNPAIIAGNVTFRGDLAQACATAYAAQYPEPTLPFPMTGIDIGTLSGSIGHGAAALAQLPACRAAFAGKLGRDAACTDSLECSGDLRCRTAPGGGKGCQPALSSGVCTSRSDCADDYRCVGPTDGIGKTCVPKDQLPDIGGNCAVDTECSVGNVCSSAGKCTPATVQNICPSNG